MSGLALRHARLAEKVGSLGVLLFNGTYQSRNYLDNTYPFRPQSNFVYMAGVCPPGSYFLLHEGNAHLFIPEYTVDDLIWSGEAPSRKILAQNSSCEIHYLEELTAFLSEIPPKNLASLPVSAPGQNAFLEKYLGRLPNLDNENDHILAEAIISLRLYHDEEAYRELKVACQATVEAHLDGLRALKDGAKSEGDIYAAMLFKANAKGYGVSFNPIITTKGERLHQIKLGFPLQRDGLLLVDFGIESADCWAGDITNTWPVSGTYNEEQRSIYNTVLRAHKDCAAMLKPGVDWVKVHRKALEVIASGLQEVGVLSNGDVETYLESNVVSLFMPHGVGHLMGIDVHDMEDLGDLAGYAPERQRSHLLGWKSLRLSRVLAEGMAVTVEPGIYFIPELLDREEFKEIVEEYVNKEAFYKFAAVHGVRIERDYFINSGGCECLTEGMPTEISEIEEFMHG